MRNNVKNACLSVSAALFLLTGACGNRDENMGEPGPLAPDTSTILEGNWSIIGTSDQGNEYRVGGHLVQKGSEVSGTVKVTTRCQLPEVVSLKGKFNGQELDFQTNPNSSGMTLRGKLTGNGKAISHLSGDFAVTNGCSPDEQGEATAIRIRHLRGSWSGTGLAIAGDPRVQVSTTFSETGLYDGYYYLSGTLDYSTSTCTAKVDVYGRIYGTELFLDVDESDNVPVLFFFSGSLDPTTSKLSGRYGTSIRSDIPITCSGDEGTITLEPKDAP